jgi:hypothetical protein
MAHVRVVRICKTSNAEMKRKFSSTELLDKTIRNPRPVIDLLSRAITELGGSFLLVLGPNFSALLTNKSLLTNAVGTYI